MKTSDVRVGMRCCWQQHRFGPGVRVEVLGEPAHRTVRAPGGRVRQVEVVEVATDSGTVLYVPARDLEPEDAACRGAQKLP